MKAMLALAAMILMWGCDPVSNDTPDPQPEPVVAETNNSEPKEEPKEEPTEKEPVLQIPYEAQPKFLTVNGIEVNPDNFNRRMKLIASFAKVVSEKDVERYRASALDEIIRQTLLEQAAKDIKVDEAATFEKIKNGIADWEGHLNKLGQTEEEFREEIAHSLRVKKLVSARIKITDEELLAYYEKNKKRLAEDEQVRASHILFRVDKDVSDEDRKKIKTNARKVAALARKKGADFAALAKEHSQGPTQKKGGDLGWFTRKAMLKEFSNAAFALKPGEVSAPVYTHHGYHIIKTFEKKEARVPSFEEVKKEIEETLRGKQAKTELRDLLVELKKKADVKVDQSKIVKNEKFKIEEPTHRVPSKVFSPREKRRVGRLPLLVFVRILFVRAAGGFLLWLFLFVPWAGRWWREGFASTFVQRGVTGALRNS